MIKNIFFDFDGVLAESLDIKADAFYKLYLSYGQGIASKVKKHHLQNGGISRYKKFVLYHNIYLNKKLSNIELQIISEQFSKLVCEAVINADEVKGSTKFLENNYKSYRMFIITGTPTKEAKYICKKRNISKYFTDIYGSPESKDYWCKYIFDKYQIINTETIFIGDAMSDYKAAKATDIKFILREHETNREQFLNYKDINKIEDFQGISI